MTRLACKVFHNLENKLLNHTNGYTFLMAPERMYLINRLIEISIEEKGASRFG